jgi:hypothetical protein
MLGSLTPESAKRSSRTGDLTMRIVRDRPISAFALRAEALDRP